MSSCIFTINGKTKHTILQRCLLKFWKSIPGRQKERSPVNRGSWLPCYIRANALHPPRSPGKRGMGNRVCWRPFRVRNDQAKPIEVGPTWVWQKCPRTLAMVTLFVGSLAPLYLLYVYFAFTAKCDGHKGRKTRGGTVLSSFPRVFVNGMKIIVLLEEDSIAILYPELNLILN